MVMIPAYDLSIPGPMARPDVKTQRLVINGPTDVRKILSVDPVMGSQGEIVEYKIQAR
jgi:hypothetical protein